MLRFVRQYLPEKITCLIAGGLIPLAFSPFDYTIIAIIATTVLFSSWYKKTAKEAFILGYLFGLGMFGVGVNWLHISINLFGGVNLVGALFITFALVACLAIYPALAGCCCQYYFRKHAPFARLIAMPLFWVLAEWLRSWVFSGFPWLNLGYSQINTPLAGIAPITGVYGLSGLTALTASLLVYSRIASRKKQIIALIAFIAIWWGAGIAKNIQWVQPQRTDMKAALVQGAIPQKIKWHPEQREKTLELYITLSEKYRGYDIIVWPETAIPMFFHQAKGFLESLDKVAEHWGSDFLIGIPFQENKKYYNSIISIGSENAVYHKKHLVPFGEYLPFDQWVRPLLNFMGIPMSDFSAGNAERPLLSAAGENIGVSICYEDTFGEEVITALPEATLLVNISNDAWFGDSLAPHQHLQIARMRALESGRYMLRSTNTGISAIINEKGIIIARSPQFIAGVTTATIKTFTGSTPYAKMGNWLMIILCVVLLVGVKIISLWKRD